ncbi:hypothetical protein Ct61P_15139 [Colletotrichum tofieldiae]|nr:hypothetical protein Ct61P_15139 [Colletotrichum tofieldiae]
MALPRLAQARLRPLGPVAAQLAAQGWQEVGVIDAPLRRVHQQVGRGRIVPGSSSRQARGIAHAFILMAAACVALVRVSSLGWRRGAAHARSPHARRVTGRGAA